MEQLEGEYAIGLDLGTTFSCIGVYRKGGVEIIPNRNGEKTTPSVVIINDSNILVGEETTDFLVKNYDSCIYEVKRLIGRKFDDEEVQKEISKLPFKIIKGIQENSADIEVTVKGKKVTYSPVEISSFIIKKMVKNAEVYLKKKINKLVITVPAYFNDSQRKLTKQAAELVGLKVIRVINEPTAAALSYGFDKKQNFNEKILVFDLGGGTFDVSILALTKEIDNQNKLSFKVLGTSGDTQLGGEDFDNVLVNFFLKKRKENEKEIRQDKKALKRLKVACENIKKILSISTSTTLRINNLFNNQDLNEVITRDNFEESCKDLFKKINDSLDEALIKSEIKKSEIHEIILVGGSTRIPKVKQLVKDYFPDSNINDSINADEAVAYGATLAAEKILYNKDELISNFHLLDIIPLSLGTDIKNNSDNLEIQKEGCEMSIIIKRGTTIPTFGTQTYYSATNNQTSMSMNIYEGEKKYVKYNHLLKKSNISGLTKRPKGKTKVIVRFDIDVNGILTVHAKEESEDNNGQTLDLIIKNDELSLSPEKIEELQRKNQELIDKMKNNDLAKIEDITNLKNSLRKYQDAFNKSIKILEEKKKNNEEDEDEDDNLMIYKTNFNNTLEEFINSFTKSLEKKEFDNETVLEKLYLYTKELFLSYIETLKLKISRGDQIDIIDKIKKYITIFFDKSSGYLNNLLETLKSITTKKKFKIYFYEIIIFSMEKLNELGKEYITSNKQFCKYHSLIYFEQSKSYYDKYLSNIDEALLDAKNLETLNSQKEICNSYIKDINCGAIVLCEESFRGGYLVPEEIISSGRGITNDLRNYSIANIKNNIERCKIVLSNYETALSSIQSENNKLTKKEAICIANIIKLNSILGYTNSKIGTLITLAKRCELIIDNLKIDKNEIWYKEFEKLNKELKKKQTPEEDYQSLFQNIRRAHTEIFDELDDEFRVNGRKIEFINFILKKHPFKNYENEKQKRDFNNYNPDLIRYLNEQYQPDNYTPSDQKEKSKVEYCIAHEISKKLSNLLTTL